ncbi:MAG: pyrroloquinoline quinone biosynthesis protein PqqB [Anaeromyxobacteraceae bacterium]
MLGAGAGGGFPQWNCGCRLCTAVRGGAPGLTARTQTSVAVSPDGSRWFLLCASPDIRAQLDGFAPLWPRSPRGSPIEGVLLPSADVDATAGLFSMREGEPIALHATSRVLDAFLERNALASTLRRTPSQLTVHHLPLRTRVPLLDRHGAPSGLEVTAIPVAGKPPPHLAGRAYHPEDNVGFVVRHDETGDVLAFVPCAGAIDGPLLDAIEGATALLFDGTFWSDDELERVAPGAPTARAMAHVPVGGPDGTLALLGRVRARRRLFVHVNNTNPMLDEGGPERARVRAAGWDVALDGMEVLP